MAAKNRSSIRATARQMLRDEIPDSADTDFAVDELDLDINECLVEVSQRRPYEVRETLTICNRSGSATATTANHLIDTTSAHFVAGDVGKTVYNSTDKTTAKVTAYTSASDITLDTDIVVSGESYTLYHLDGTSGKDLSIASITDLIEVEKAEYRTRQSPRDFRNVTVFGDVLTLDIDFTPTDGDEVFLYCHKVHSLTESASTLNPDLEKVLVEGVVAKASLAWCAEKLRNDIVPASVRSHHTWANNQFLIYQNSLNSITRPRVWEFY